MALFPITLFGMLQTLHGQRTLNLEAQVPLRVKDLQSLLAHSLGGCDVPVALAESNRILKPEEILEAPRPLMALPPVCGG